MDARPARVNTSKNSSTPWSSVETGPKLGFGMFQSANTIGSEPVTSMPVAVRWPLTVNVTDFEVPCIVSMPVACVEECTPTEGIDGSTIGLDRVNVAVG